MTIRIPATVFDGLEKWVERGPWPGHFQEAVYDHFDAYCAAHDFDTTEELEAEIGEHWVAALHDIAMNDFLSRKTRDGNVVDQYLKRRGWCRVGGYLNRRNDGPPGHQTVWEGYTRLVTGALTIERIEENGAASALHPYLARNRSK